MGARNWKEAKQRKRRAVLRHRERRSAERAQRGPGAPPTAKAGIAAIVLGLLVAVYFGAIYDTTVTLPVDVRVPGGPVAVHNQGRMNTRTVGCIAGIGVAVVGGLLLVVNSRAAKKARSG
jgi:hypothetical protein